MMEIRKKRTQRDYTLAFKLGIVEDVEKGNLTYKQAQKKYGIQGRSTVLVWLRKHGTLDWTLPNLYTLAPAEKTPEQRIKELEAALETEKLKTLFLTTAIDIAEKQYGMVIKKKYSPKQQENFKRKTKCRLFGISRQGFYQRERRHHHRLLELQKVKALVTDQRRLMPRLGTRKIHFLIQEDLHSNDIKIGRDALFDFLRSENLLVKPRKSYTKTTWSKHWLHKHPNLLKSVKACRAEQIWVSDITHIATRAGNTYLSLITDAFSRKIVGYHLSNDLRTEGVAQALKSAVSKRGTMLPLIHHSDRGLQYCSQEYQNVLKKHKITPSMTDGYDCYQNALAERINGILKDEFLLTTCENEDQLRKVIDQSVKIYNTRRPHLNLDYKTPTFIHKKSLAEINNQGSINQF